MALLFDSVAGEVVVVTGKLTPVAGDPVSVVRAADVEDPAGLVDVVKDSVADVVTGSVVDVTTASGVEVRAAVVDEVVVVVTASSLLVDDPVEELAPVAVEVTGVGVRAVVTVIDEPAAALVVTTGTSTTDDDVLEGASGASLVVGTTLSGLVVVSAMGITVSWGTVDDVECISFMIPEANESGIDIVELVSVRKMGDGVVTSGLLLLAKQVTRYSTLR